MWNNTLLDSQSYINMQSVLSTRLHNNQDSKKNVEELHSCLVGSNIKREKNQFSICM